MMTPRRRTLLWGLPALLAGCGLSERPFAERRQWPLLVQRPDALPPPRNGLVLEVRELRAGPGLEARGLQSLQPDGSIRVGFYEEWSVAPAQALEDSLRHWLADSGRFAAIAEPGSRLAADMAFDGTLTAFWTDPAHGTARATIALTLIDLRSATRHVLLQTTKTATSPLPATDAAASAHALRDAAAEVFTQVEVALGGAVRR